MTGDMGSLTEAERYTVWCENVRALFERTSPGDATDSVSDEAYFPYCFYTRMLRSLERCGGSTRAGEQSERSSVDGDSYYSSVSHQHARLDEDALAVRLTSKLQTHARALARQHRRQRKDAEEARPTTAMRLPFRDCAVEAKVAAVNEDLCDMLLYVRRQNALANQLRRQLEGTRRLLVMQVPSSS